MRPFVLYILCPSRSGSTLLGNVLGGHPELLHIGEVVAPVRKARALRCRLCGDDPCPLWGGALPADFVEAAVHRFDGAPEGPGPGALHERVLAAFPGVRGLVDGSKKLPWARFHARSAAHDHRFLFLRRDLRGCLASWKRTGPDQLAATARSAARQIQELDRFAASLPADRARIVRYEDLVAAPSRAVADIVAWLGLPRCEGLADHAQHDNHVVGGNPGPMWQRVSAAGRSVALVEADMDPQQLAFYRGAGSAFVADERWRAELVPADLALVAELLGDAQRTWGYGLS